VGVADSGWFYAHEAIRVDISDALQILERLAATPSPAPWESAALAKWWHFVYEFIEHHHDNEEQLFFPRIAERVELPPRLTADHKTMLAALKETDAIVKAETAKPPGTADWAKAATSLRHVEAIILPHLLEEEHDTLPAMMANFTAKELEPTERAMIKAQPWWSLGHLYRRFRDDMVVKQRHAVGSLGVPSVVFGALIRPKIEKYQAEVGWLVEELKQPQSHAFWEEQRALWHARSGFGGCCGPKPRGSFALAQEVGSGTRK